MNSDHITINFSPGVTLSLSPGAVRGILLLGFAFYFRRKAKDSFSPWSNLYQPIPRSFENTTSPIDLVAMGCGGVISWVLYNVLFICTLALGIDQMFADGNWFWVRHQEILQQAGDIISRIIELFITLLRGIAADVGH